MIESGVIAYLMICTIVSLDITVYSITHKRVKNNLVFLLILVGLIFNILIRSEHLKKFIELVLISIVFALVITLFEIWSPGVVKFFFATLISIPTQLYATYPDTSIVVLNYLAQIFAPFLFIKFFDIFRKSNISVLTYNRLKNIALSNFKKEIFSVFLFVLSAYLIFGNNNSINHLYLFLFVIFLFILQKLNAKIQKMVLYFLSIGGFLRLNMDFIDSSMEIYRFLKILILVILLRMLFMNLKTEEKPLNFIPIIFVNYLVFCIRLMVGLIF